MCSRLEESKTKMTRTRRSSRLSQINHIQGATEEKRLTACRTRRRVTQQIVLSSDSEDEYDFFVKDYQPRTPRKQKSCDNNIDLSEISPVTPPKQNKLNGPESEKVENKFNTPSTLMRKMALVSPSHHTPLEKLEPKSNRKNLFKIEDESSKGTDLIKQSDIQKVVEQIDFEISEQNPYQNAKKALHGAVPTEMPGREKEHKELKSFIKTHLINKTSGSLYVSGPPGTGKTASLNLILKEEKMFLEFHELYVNCTAIKSASSVYSRIAKELGLKLNSKVERDCLTKVEDFLKRNSEMIVLVLDEIDQLESKNQSILYTIFEWPSKPNSHIILIGIANALDLTDRILPRLQARCELKPKLMHFAPYTKQQIIDIITSRLKSADVLDVFSPVALQMLAGKVAAVSGDVRRALDIGRRVVDLVDQGKKKGILKPIENLTHDIANEKKIVQNKSKPVDLKEVVTVLNNVYGTTQNLTNEEGVDDSFPLQQKIIICSLLLMLKKAKNKDITVGKLHDVYTRVCAKRNILAVDQAEFVGLCSLVETRGIIRVSGRKEPRLHKVNLEWDENEVAAALKDKQLMSMILQDDSCLGRH